MWVNRKTGEKYSRIITQDDNGTITLGRTEPSQSIPWPTQTFFDDFEWDASATEDIPEPVTE